MVPEATAEVVLPWVPVEPVVGAPLLLVAVAVDAVPEVEVPVAVEAAAVDAVVLLLE